MAIDRSLDYTGYSDGAAWAADVDATVNWLSGQNLGRLQNVAGTNSLTANLNVDNGFSDWSTDAHFVFVAAANNTGAMTLQIQDTDSPPNNLGSAIALRNSGGSALAADDIISGRAYFGQYDSTDGYARIMQEVPSQGATGAISLDRQTFSSSSSWVKPSGLSADAMVLVRIWGPGGDGGGSGNAGGGGGGFKEALFHIDDLSSSETVTIGTPGSNSTFGSLATAYHGGDGDAGNTAGGGGGELGAGQDGSAGGAAGEFGGGGASVGTNANSIWAGAAGGSGIGSDGGDAIFGGGGGAGDSPFNGGISEFGGDGGDTNQDGSVPGGGGGGTGNGAAGYCEVLTFG